MRGAILSMGGMSSTGGMRRDLKHSLAMGQLLSTHGIQTLAMGLSACLHTCTTPCIRTLSTHGQTFWSMAAARTGRVSPQPTCATGHRSSGCGVQRRFGRRLRRTRGAEALQRFVACCASLGACNKASRDRRPPVLNAPCLAPYAILCVHSV